MKRLAALLFALSVSSVSSSANEQNQKLLALSAEDRNLALTSHVQRSGKDCDAVVRSMQITDESGKAAVWSVGCKNENTYAVSIFADSGLQPFVVSCNDLKDYGKLLGLMERRLNSPQNSQVAECWKKF
jgi:hypothetical protein